MPNSEFPQALSLKPQASSQASSLKPQASSQASSLKPQASPGFLAHSFRLRDPWQCDSTEGGGLRWSRVFHRPTGLEPDDQLVLVLTGAPPTTQVTINGQAFPPASSLKPQVSQFDLTAILADDNRIEILIPPQASSLKPQASPASSPFPYDARLAVIGHS